MNEPDVALIFGGGSQSSAGTKEPPQIPGRFNMPLLPARAIGTNLLFGDAKKINSVYLTG